MFIAPITSSSGGGGGGSGTVTSVGVVTANGVSASTSSATTTPRHTFLLGNIVPSSLVVTPLDDRQAGVFRRNSSSQTSPIIAIQTEANAALGSIDKDGNITMTNLSGTNTGDQVGDGVTITGAGTVGNPFVAVSTGGGGSGTVTSVGTTPTDGVVTSVATATTTPNISISLSDITPDSITATPLTDRQTAVFRRNSTGQTSKILEIQTQANVVLGSIDKDGNIAMTNLSGTNTGDQTNISGNAATVTTNANLTGAVTSVGNATTMNSALDSLTDVSASAPSSYDVLRWNGSAWADDSTAGGGDAGVAYFHGIVARPVGASNPLPSTIATTTFTLGATANPISYYYLGVRVDVTSDKTVVLTDGTAGLYHIYFNAGLGTLLASKTFPGVSDTSNVYIANVAWNGVDYGLVSDERHGYKRDHEWHVWAHDTVGVRYKSGCTLTVTGTGASATLALTVGEIRDEDIKFVVDAQTSCRLVWQNGASTYTFDKTLSTVPYKRGTGDRPVYIDSSVAYAITTLPSAVNRYMVYFMYATPDLSCPLYCVVSTSTSALVLNGYTTVANARAVPFPTIPVGSISLELRPIYRVIVRADGVVQAIDTALDDYRTVSTLPQGAGTTSTTASAVTFNPSGNIVAATVQTAIEEIDLEKEPAITTLSIAKGGTNSGTALTNGKLIVSAAGAIKESVYNMPGDGTAGYVLKTDGAGNLSWVVQSGGGGGSQYLQPIVHISAVWDVPLTMTVGASMYAFWDIGSCSLTVTGLRMQTLTSYGTNAIFSLGIYKRNGSNVPELVSGTLITTAAANTNYKTVKTAFTTPVNIIATHTDVYYIGVVLVSASGAVTILKGQSYGGAFAFTGTTGLSAMPSTETVENSTNVLAAIWPY